VKTTGGPADSDYQPTLDTYSTLRHASSAGRPVGSVVCTGFGVCTGRQGTEGSMFAAGLLSSSSVCKEGSEIAQQEQSMGVWLWL
jgi:hypothetical protein